MEAAQATATGATRIYSVAILGERGVGVEVLVVPTLVNRAVEDTATVFGIELTGAWPSDYSAAQLPSTVRWLFEKSVAAGTLDQEVLSLDGLDKFCDEVVFTRQVPVERSPLRSWSIAELWTSAAGPLGGVGVGFASGHWPIALVCGVFGTLLIRPIAAVSQGIAEGLHAVAREATEEFAREWLRGRRSNTDAGSAPENPPPPIATAVPLVVDPGLPEEGLARAERSSERLELEAERPEVTWRNRVVRLRYTVEREILHLLARLDGIAEVVERENRRFSRAEVQGLLDAIEGTKGLVKAVYDPLADRRSATDLRWEPTDKSFGSIDWTAMPDATSALGDLGQQLQAVVNSSREFAAAYQHLDVLREIHPVLVDAYDRWSELPTLPPLDEAG